MKGCAFLFVFIITFIADTTVQAMHQECSESSDISPNTKSQPQGDSTLFHPLSPGYKSSHLCITPQSNHQQSLSSSFLPLHDSRVSLDASINPQMVSPEKKYRLEDLGDDFMKFYSEENPGPSLIEHNSQQSPDSHFNNEFVLQPSQIKPFRSFTDLSESIKAMRKSLKNGISIAEKTEETIDAADVPKEDIVKQITKQEAADSSPCTAAASPTTTDSTTAATFPHVQSPLLEEIDTFKKMLIQQCEMTAVLMKNQATMMKSVEEGRRRNRDTEAFGDIKAFAHEAAAKLIELKERLFTTSSNLLFAIAKQALVIAEENARRVIEQTLALSFEHITMRMRTEKEVALAASAPAIPIQATPFWRIFALYSAVTIAYNTYKIFTYSYEDWEKIIENGEKITANIIKSARAVLFKSLGLEQDGLFFLDFAARAVEEFLESRIRSHQKSPISQFDKYWNNLEVLLASCTPAFCEKESHQIFFWLHTLSHSVKIFDNDLVLNFPETKNLKNRIPKQVITYIEEEVNRIYSINKLEAMHMQLFLTLLEINVDLPKSTAATYAAFANRDL